MFSWLDAMQTVEDTRQFIQSTQDEFAKGAALHHVLLCQGSLVGVVSFNSIDKINGIGQIGYWLGEPYTRRGLMTASVADLIQLGFNELCLERVEIRCAVENWRNRAIPERLGFELEGTLRSVQKVGKARYAHAVYGLLASEQLSY